MDTAEDTEPLAVVERAASRAGPSARHGGRRGKECRGDARPFRPGGDRRFHIADAEYAGRDGDRTLEEISEIVGLQVYTNQGVFLGNVNNLVVDVENGAVDGLFVGETNPLLVEGGRAVSVPYRWIQSVGDIVILRYFPKRVSLKKPAAAVPAMVPEK